MLTKLHIHLDTQYVTLYSSISSTLCRLKHTFCSQEDSSFVHSRHLESNTKTNVGLLNVTLSLDTDNIHVRFDQVIHGSSIENGISH